MGDLKQYISSSSECVGSGHPDKIADQIADAIFDESLKHGKYSQVSCEILVSKKLVVIAGECHIPQEIDFVKIATNVLLKFSYDVPSFKFVINVNRQSSDIRATVIKSNSLVASGDQGIVFGFACNESEEYLPLSYVIARDLVWEAEKLIKNQNIVWLKHDIKSAITIHREHNCCKINTLIFSIQHDEKHTQQQVVDFVEKHIIHEVVVKKHKFKNEDIINKLINTSGSFVTGGLDADSGQNNRKLMIDVGGTRARHGGGGLSGKDLSKIDKSGFYYSRWICKNLVAAGVASWIELKIIYFIGALNPHEYAIECATNYKHDKNKIIQCIKEIFPQKINDVIELFLNSDVCYEDLAAHGHVGRNDLDLPWERLDKVEQIKQWFSKHS